MDAAERVVIVFSGPTAAQQIQLQQVESIDIRKAELNGFTKRGMTLEQLGLAGQRKHRIPGEVPFRANAVEDVVRQFLIFNQIGVTTRNLEVRFGQDHFKIGDNGSEKLRVAVQRFELILFTALSHFAGRGAEAEPTRKHRARLRPAENPWDSSQIFNPRGVGARGRTAADLQVGYFRQGGGLPEIDFEAGRLINQRTIGLVCVRAENRKTLGKL